MALSKGGGGVWPVTRMTWEHNGSAAPQPGLGLLTGTWFFLGSSSLAPEKQDGQVSSDSGPGPIPSPAPLLLQDLGLADLVHLRKGDCAHKLGAVEGQSGQVQGKL